jgi:hypothetical protein
LILFLVLQFTFQMYTSIIDSVEANLVNNVGFHITVIILYVIAATFYVKNRHHINYKAIPQYFTVDTSKRNRMVWNALQAICTLLILIAYITTFYAKSELTSDVFNSEIRSISVAYFTLMYANVIDVFMFKLYNPYNTIIYSDMIYNVIAMLHVLGLICYKHERLLCMILITTNAVIAISSYIYTSLQLYLKCKDVPYLMPCINKIYFGHFMVVLIVNINVLYSSFVGVITFSWYPILLFVLLMRFYNQIFTNLIIVREPLPNKVDIVTNKTGKDKSSIKSNVGDKDEKLTK